MQRHIHKTCVLRCVVLVALALWDTTISRPSGALLLTRVNSDAAAVDAAVAAALAAAASCAAADERGARGSASEEFRRGLWANEVW